MSLEHILLGMLEKPASGYDLKREFDQGAKHFWSAELSQIYPTLQRMRKRGWLAERREPSDKGPPRRTYRRTDAGTKELKRWLALEPIMGTERFAYIAQLIFHGQLDDLQRTLEFVEQLRERLAQFHQLLRSAEQHHHDGYSRVPQDLNGQEFHDWLCLGLGVSSLQAKVAWCDQAMQAIRQRIKSRARQKETNHV